MTNAVQNLKLCLLLENGSRMAAIQTVCANRGHTFTLAVKPGEPNPAMMYEPAQ